MNKEMKKFIRVFNPKIKCCKLDSRELKFSSKYIDRAL